MIIAQISDLHVGAPGQRVFGGVDSAGNLARCVRHILTLVPQPDVVLVTGDLVDRGTAEEYAHVRALLAPLPMPYYVIPGNHDAREVLRTAFADQRYVAEVGEFCQ